MDDAATSKPLPSVRKLLIWLVLACLVPALLGGAALMLHEYQDGLARLQRDTLQTARALVQAVDAKLAQVELLAQTLATSDTLARKDFAAFHRRAQTLLQESSIAQNILIYDANGQQRVNIRLPFGTDLPTRANLAQIERVFASAKPVTSEVFLSPLTGLPMISVAVPVFSGGKVVFVLAACIAPQEFNRMLTEQKLPPEWVVAVLDSAGTIAARSHSPEKFVGHKAVPELLKSLQEAPEGVLEVITSEGISTLTPYSRSPQSGWSVAIGIPHQELEADLRRHLLPLGLGAVLLLGLSLGLAWLVAARMTQSIRTLHTSAIALGAGELSEMQQAYFREVAEVAQAMTRAAHLLKVHTRELEVSNEALLTREAELSDAQRIASIGSWSWDAQTDATVASPELCRIFGMPNIPPFAQQDGIMFPHASWLVLHQARQEVLHTGEGYNLEVAALHVDGRPFWVNSRSEVVRDGGGAIIGLRGMVQDITERKQAESIAKSERFIRTITDAMPDLIAYWDRDLRCRFANPSYLAWWGKSAKDMMDTPLQALMGESLFAINEPAIRSALAGQHQQFERYLTKPDGSVGHVLANYIPDINEHGDVVGIIIIVTDIKAHKLAEAELKLAAAVYQNTAEAIMVTDSNGLIQSVNPAFTEITGYPAQEAIGQTPRLLRSHHHDNEFHAGMWQQINQTGQWQGEIWNRRKNGEIYLAWQTITRIAGSGGDTDRFVAVFRDITASWQKNEHIRHLAFHDALTDLPNRSLLMERLERQISMSERDPRCLAVLFLDLDRFKAVNDTLGHAVGDDLLVAVAQKLQALVRQSDTVARLGGDEFVIMLDNPAHQDEVVHIANRIIAVISEPMAFNGQTAQVGTSIGIAMFPADGATAAELIKSADTALYQAKQAGRNTYRFFALEAAVAAAK